MADDPDDYFIYKKECRFAWVKYLGLLGKIKLRDGPDGLPYFIGMPPEYSTFRIEPQALADIQQKVLENPLNSLITIEFVLSTLRTRPVHTHVAWQAIQRILTKSSSTLTSSEIHAVLNQGISLYTNDRDNIKAWERIGMNDPAGLLSPGTSGSPPGQSVMQTMNRLVGMQSEAQGPTSSPNYLPVMGTFQRAIRYGGWAKDDERKKWGEMALQAIRTFMNTQKNEEIIETMLEYRRHYEALAAIEEQATHTVL